jgi:3-hydroxyacyl-CoA dehydrogenase
MFKKVCLIGANGSMGAKIAAIIAGFGDLPVYMVARDLEKSKKGIEIAVKSIRSNAIRKNLMPATFTQLPKILKECDWVFEAVAEEYTVKEVVNKEIAKNPKKNRVISTLTSGLSIQKLAEPFSKEDKQNYIGIHFFNPPYKMLLCEIIPSSHTSKSLINSLAKYLEKQLNRVVVITKDLPGFVANRIGFQLMNEAAQFAQKYKKRGGVEYIDSLLGPYTGRSLGPLETIDFVGLDIHKAVVKNLYENLNDDAKESFQIPAFLQYLIKKEKLGSKSGEGIYTMQEVEGVRKKLVFNIATNTYIPYNPHASPVVLSMKEHIRNAEYQKAYQILLDSSHDDAKIVKYFISRYISYSYSLIGTVVQTREEIDKAMGFGFNWLPPSAFVDMLGGPKKAISLIKSCRLPIPHELSKNIKQQVNFYQLNNLLDYRSLIKL